MKRILLLLTTFALLALNVGARAADEFLDPDVAFKLSARAAEAGRVEVRFDIAPGYYLYGEKFSVEAQPDPALLSGLQVPKGKVKFDETFQKNVEYFRDSTTLVASLAQAPTAAFKLTVGNQGCADKGLCYPPQQRSFRVEPGSGGAMSLTLLTEAQSAAWTPTGGTSMSVAATGGGQIGGAATGLASAAGAAAAPNAALGAAAEPGHFAQALQSRSLLTVAGVFLLAGLLLSFTPCVLPMIPILSSIIVGQSGHVSRARGFGLALAYSLGMALVYTAFGMAAGLAGEGLAAALQNAWVLGGFALLLALLSLSMFGVYELQMPGFVQTRVTQWSGNLKGGQHVGVFLMGGLSALIVGPCVAAPLAGALVYISQTKDVVLGGVALFALASGMSVPLLLVGLSAGSLLPRAGVWMERVKHFFGVMLLAVALWLVSPVLPGWAMMVGAAALLLASAVYLGAFERLPDGVTPGRAVTKGAGLMLAVLATLQLAGVASGGRDLLQPLQHLSAGASGGGTLVAKKDELHFQTVKTVAGLDAALQASARPVMLDFYADWCVACKEMEAFTFTDAAVRQRLAGMTLLRVDVTANNADDKALMRKFGLFGPPALLFFAPAGDEMSQARVIGFQNAKAFGAHLDRVGSGLPGGATSASSAVKLSLK